MINYQLETDRIIRDILGSGEKKSLLLHCCCAPCSSYVLEYLCAYFDITVYFYNPNITQQDEYIKRKNELIRFIGERKPHSNIKMLDADYDTSSFFKICKGREQMDEGGERCFDCYRLRLDSTAAMASEHGFDYFCTTLSISPHKNAEKLNEIGKALSEKYGVKYLFSDFKKRNGYKRSIELSAEYSLYRQSFCGCIYSKAQADKREKIKKAKIYRKLL